ncbi:MAG: hypothetical protein H6684_12815 [Deltaproteobacteria bacterium]|nr:hypothetical protein [bacterium]MCB9475276.1 hypothetical protein [Deltaproteobacteria bacterium]MCB9479510.1 hypothetical protein [Deltaproteobacteria bacterium]MCB9489606.1 hypothetical protein [Deltaproteobacteria bacterium]
MEIPKFSEFCIAAQKALLGNVSANLKTVTITRNDRSITLDFVFVDAAGDSDQAAVSEVVNMLQSELDLEFGTGYHVFQTINSFDASHNMQLDRQLILEKKEVENATST